jgi:NAD(P)-dependent dehydrogenase (short-subunit alcohol dehydrogenase family)
MDSHVPTGTLIVTGGNAGLGYQAALQLAAERRWHVVLACRRPAEGAQAAKAIADATGHPHVEAMPLDLASLASVRQFAAEFTDQPQALAAGRPPLRAIICNAGVQVISGTMTTAEGFEATFGVNHLGHFLLVNLLLSRLEAPARVIFVASGTHDPAQRTGMPVPNYTDPYALATATPVDAREAAQVGQTRYTTSKLCNVLCAYELARRLEAAGLSTPERPIAVTAFDPGLMPGSGLARDYGPLQQFGWKYILPVLRFFARNVHTTEESGRALARLATDPALAGVTGRYFEGMAEIRSSEASYDLEKARHLWEASADMVGLRPDESPLAAQRAEA